ncbi:MAG: DUF465 domain-containing protein [Alphaproteobacteria bacterium]
MALQQRIESLEKRHAHIKQQIIEEEAHLATDDGLLHKLKWQKLVLKDEISRLRGDYGRQAA